MSGRNSKLLRQFFGTAKATKFQKRAFRNLNKDQRATARAKMKGEIE